MNDFERICGKCKHFMPFENRRSGRCAKREFLYKKGGSASVMNRKFIANYSRKACVTDFEPIVLKKQTNFERIKAMSIEELAECLTLEILERTADIANADCFLCDETHCTKCLKHWLENEVQGNDL